MDRNFNLTLDEVDDINLKMGEVLAMVEVLAAGSHGDVGCEKHFQTFAYMLKDKAEEVKKAFKQATSKDEAAQGGG